MKLEKLFWCMLGITYAAIFPTVILAAATPREHLLFDAGWRLCPRPTATTITGFCGKTKQPFSARILFIGRMFASYVITYEYNSVIVKTAN
jgi:hypothetical protein